MDKIVVAEIDNTYLYDNFGKPYKNVGNCDYSVGETVYTLAGYVVGRVPYPQIYKPFARKKRGLSGWPVFDSTAGDGVIPRIIPPIYYQSGMYDRFTGYMVGTDYYIDDNFVLQEYDDTREDITEYNFPGIYNTDKALVEDYALVSNNTDRLLTVINDSPIVQSGFLKCGIGDNKTVVTNCELLIDDDISCYDRTYTTVNASSLAGSVQNYLYLSQYEQSEGQYISDDSVKYTGASIATLSISDGTSIIALADVLKDALDKSLNTATAISQKPDDIDVWPALDVRPQPSPAIAYYEACDNSYTRIDDALSIDGTNLQVSNIKLFECSYNADNALECTIHLHVVAITYAYITHTIYDGSTIAEWCPVTVDNYLTYRVSTSGFDCVHYHYNSHFLSHTMYAEPGTGTGMEHISSNINVTPYSTISVDIGGMAIDVHAYKLGALSSGYNNTYIDDTIIINNTYTININSALYYDSADKCVKTYGDGTVILMLSTCDFGLSKYKDCDILLVDNHAYLIKGSQLLKIVDLSNLFDANYQTLNVALVHTDDIDSIYKEVTASAQN